jgi:hypothetical protein
MKTKIYAYYESIPLANQPEEFACANWWKNSWEKNGWEAVMLNRSHAQGSHLYQKLTSKLINTNPKLPNEIQNRFAWMVTRFSRWCALHAAGGGWMSDYDVANIAFNPTIAGNFEQEGTLHMVAGEPCWLFYATKEHCAAAINKFIQSELVEDSAIRNEADILDVKGQLYPIMPFLFHAKKNGDTQRSAVMANAVS